MISEAFDVLLLPERVTYSIGSVRSELPSRIVQDHYGMVMLGRLAVLRIRDGLWDHVLLAYWMAPAVFSYATAAGRDVCAAFTFRNSLYGVQCIVCNRDTLADLL